MGRLGVAVRDDHRHGKHQDQQDSAQRIHGGSLAGHSTEWQLNLRFKGGCYINGAELAGAHAE
jgi:hypothetical protein